MPRWVAKSPTIGMEPPERVKTVGLPKTSLKALAATRICRMVGIYPQAGAGTEHAHFALNAGDRFSFFAASSAVESARCAFTLSGRPALGLPERGRFVPGALPSNISRRETGAAKPMDAAMLRVMAAIRGLSEESARGGKSGGEVDRGAGSAPPAGDSVMSHRSGW